jgi:hypothetical protein
MNWRIKGVVQKALGIVPGGTRVNDLLQRTVGGLRNFERQVAGKVEDWEVFVDHLRTLGLSVRGLKLFEIGTGWFPTLPICFILAGAAACITVDLNRHLHPHLSRRMLVALRPHLPRISSRSGRSLGEVTADYERLTQTGSLTEMLAAARIDYRAPADATRTTLPPGSVDVVFSNSVLEHVRPEAIAGMMRESRRILRVGGLTIHCLNCGDHYAYFDRTITPINYLTYPAQRWRFWDNALLYQNRLRPQDFTEMAESEGLEVVLNVYRPRRELLEAMQHMSIAEEFRRYPPEQLCSTSVAFAGMKDGSREAGKAG